MATRHKQTTMTARADVTAVAEVMGHAAARLSAHALQAEEKSGQRRTRPAAGQDLTVAGAQQRPHRPGVLAPDHGPTDRKNDPLSAEYPPCLKSRRETLSA